MKAWRSWLWLLLLVPLALGIARLNFDVEILNLLPKLPVVQGLKLYEQHFSSARELIIALENPDPEKIEADARTLAEALRPQTSLVSSVIWQPPWLEDPASVTELLGLMWLNQPPHVFGELTNRLALPNLTNTLQEARERLATSLSPDDLGFGGYDPYGLAKLPDAGAAELPFFGSGEEMFSSADRTFRLLYVEARPALSDYKACRAWIKNIQGVVAQARSSGKLSSQTKVSFTGRPAFVADISLSMQQDMGGASAGTLLVIGLLFWLTHRRILPLLWLLVLLIGILAGTLAVGGLVIGTINIVSIGFASILLGLVEDFGIVIYEESRSHPQSSAVHLRREAAPGIWWSTLTTAGAFLTLNISGLPGLGQLGSMVAIGILLGAFVMLYGYTALLLRFRKTPDLQPSVSKGNERLLLFQTSRLLPAPLLWAITALMLIVSSALLWQHGLRFDNSPDPLRPKNSEAYATIEKIKKHLARSEDPLWVLVPGRDETQVGNRLDKLGAFLKQAASNQWISGFTLPSQLWPRPEHQQSNRSAVLNILQNRHALRQAALTAGFTSNAFFLTDNILVCWARAREPQSTLWPTNRASRWLVTKFAAHTPGGFMALGLVQPTKNPLITKNLAANWPPDLQQEGVTLSGYNLLGWTVFDFVSRELPLVIVPIFVLVLASLWLAFRSFKEVCLSLATLLFSALCLVAAMDLLNWKWNLLNLMALPLLLGVGVDFSIHMQLALRRYHGDLLHVRRTIGRALLLAGSTTIAGFGSLGFSSNLGMASLGLVCALGIALALLTAVFLLPVWWTSLNATKS